MDKLLGNTQSPTHAKASMLIVQRRKDNTVKGKDSAKLIHVSSTHLKIYLIPVISLIKLLHTHRLQEALDHLGNVH